jgi:hypothetical protein
MSRLRPSGSGAPGPIQRPSGSGETTLERVRAIVEIGFTERQARFLLLVMRHAGLCLPRRSSAIVPLRRAHPCRSSAPSHAQRNFQSAWRSERTRPSFLCHPLRI